MTLKLVAPEPMPPREIAARAIYDRRPFTIAQSGGVMDMMRVDKVLDWDGAPAFYQAECYELADAVLARLALAGFRLA